MLTHRWPLPFCAGYAPFLLILVSDDKLLPIKRKFNTDLTAKKSRKDVFHYLTYPLLEVCKLLPPSL